MARIKVVSRDNKTNQELLVLYNVLDEEEKDVGRKPAAKPSGGVK
jgi:hypothetical protein